MPIVRFISSLETKELLRSSWWSLSDMHPCSSSVLVDGESTVFVCDRENNRIQVFSADGQFREMWSGLRRPLHISMASDGVLCVGEGGVNGLSARVSLLDKRGNVVARWDANSAHGSWIDAHGDIYMALGAMERVDKYVRQR